MSSITRNIYLFLILTSLFFACNSQLKPQISKILEKTFTKNDNITQIFYVIGTKKLEESKQNIPLDDLVASLYKKLESEDSRAFLENLYTKRYTADEIKQIAALVENPMFERYSEELIEITKEGLARANTLMDEILGEAPSRSVAPSNEIIEVTAQNFEEQILNTQLPVVFDFYAEWCGPCKTIDHMLRELSAEFGGQVRFARLDVVKEKEIAEKFQVSDLPVVLFIQNGKIIEKQKGFATKEALKKKILQLLKTQINKEI